MMSMKKVMEYHYHLWKVFPISPDRLILLVQCLTMSTLEEPDYQTLMKTVLRDFSIPEKLTRRKHSN